MPIVFGNIDSDELAIRSPEICSFIPETDENLELEILLEESAVGADVSEPNDQIEVSSVMDINQDLSVLSLSGQQKRVRFDATENENENQIQCETENAVLPLTQDVSHGNDEMLQGLPSGLTSFGFGGDISGAENLFNRSFADQAGSPFDFNNSKDVMAELTEPNTDAEDVLPSKLTQPKSAKSVSKDYPIDQISFEAVNSQNPDFSLNNFNFEEEDQPTAAKRPKFDFELSRTTTQNDFELSRTTTQNDFQFEAFANGELGNLSSCGFNFNDDNTDDQEVADFDFGVSFLKNKSDKKYVYCFIFLGFKCVWKQRR